jgi:glycerol-3-phosphate dehydrogenase
MSLGSFDRTRSLARLAEERFDVLVIGGGITGAGVALDAAARGLRTALVERDDFASGTSSKSSKMIHGGLRYLQQGDVRLVYEALAERQRLRNNAPHLVKLLPFLIPFFTGRDGVIPKGLTRALGTAMWMYDLTGGARIGKLHDRLSRDEVLARMPTLPAGRIAGGYLYYDAGADDARLTLAVARTAAIDFGATLANGVEVTGLLKDGDGKVAGVRARPEGGAEIRIRARSVVNACGVWSDDVRALDEGADPGSIRPAKGVHVTVPWELVRNTIAVVVPVPGDKRSVFVVPWSPTPEGGFRYTYIGTTDTDYEGPLDDPQCTPEDIEYVLRAINFSIGARPGRDGDGDGDGGGDGGGSQPITPDDILGTWAGLRPLVRSASSGRTADLSRGHQVRTSESGMVTITGGKLTTYRHMAADTVDTVLDQLGQSVEGRVSRRSPTKALRLRGAEGYDELAASPDARTRALADRHGGEARVVLAMIERSPELGEVLVPGTDYLKAEAVYAARYEMARTVTDVLARRTRALLQQRDASLEVAGDVAALLAPELGWDAAETERQVADYAAVVERERAAMDRSPQDA